MVCSGPNKEESVGSQCEDQFVNLEKRINCEVNQTPSVHIGHTSRSHSRIGSHVSHGKKTQNLKLEIDYVANNKRHPILALELIQVEMIVTGQGLEHLLVNPFLYLHNWIERSNIRGRGIKARPLGAWGMMQQVRLYARFLNHLLPVELIGLNSLASLYNSLLLFLMGRPIPWSMSVISIRGWLFILGMNL